jgi:hypothetical protein
MFTYPANPRVWWAIYGWGVRSTDIQIGLEYTLVRVGPPRRVTALATPDDVRGRGLVRVRFEDGVAKGKVTYQQLRFIKSRWGESAPPAKRERTPRKVIESGPWPPEVGDRVLWSETDDIEWTVAAVDHDAETVEIVGTLFSLEQTRTVPLARLSPVRMEIELVAPPEPESPRAPAETRPRPRREPSESDDRTPLQRAVDRLEFSEACLQQYRADFESKVPWFEIGKRLRQELRNHGRIVRRNRREYLRIRSRRFDVVVPSPATDTEPFLVERLWPLGRHKKR